MAADAWVLYSSGKLNIHDGTFTLGSDSLKAALFLSTYTPSAGHSTYASISADEHAGANGYTTGGDSVAGTVTESSGTITFDIADPQWTATGGSIVCRYVVLYNSTSGQLIGYALLDNSPADVTTTDTNVLTLQINASGVYQAA